MQYSSSLNDFISNIKVSANLTWFLIFIGLFCLGGVSYYSSPLGIKSFNCPYMTRNQEIIDIIAGCLVIVIVYARYKICSRNYLIKKVTRLPKTSAGMSLKPIYRDYKLKLSNHLARKFNKLSVGEQRILYIHYLYFYNLKKIQYLTLLFCLVGFAQALNTGEFSVMPTYLGVSSFILFALLLPTQHTVDLTIGKARAIGLITSS